MKLSEGFFTSIDDMNIHYYKWIEDISPKAVVLMVHGMSEKAIRYSHVAASLCEKGYAAYAMDNRGHGKTAGGEFGYMGSGDVFLKMVKDIDFLVSIIKKDFPDVPVFVLGHSMGSFLALRYMQVYPDEVRGIIMSGTGGEDQAKASIMGGFVAGISLKLFGPKRKAKYIKKITTRRFNAKIAGGDEGSWLSRDPAVEKELSSADDMGFVFTSSAYYYMFKGIKENFSKANMNAISKDAQIYILGGSDDALGNYGDGVIALQQFFRHKLGIKDVTLRLYKEGRHEMLNEINKDEVKAQLISWLDSKIQL